MNKEKENKNTNPEKKHDVCPLSDAKKMTHPLRMLAHRPRNMFGKYIKPGDMIIDFGCGPGTFTLALSGMTGPEGKVYAVDLQPGMLEILKGRMKGKKKFSNITTVNSTAESTGLEIKADLVVAFFVVHEVPDKKAFFKEMHHLLKPGGFLYIAEPERKYQPGEFDELINECISCGFFFSGSPKIAKSLTAVFQKS